LRTLDSGPNYGGGWLAEVRMTEQIDHTQQSKRASSSTGCGSDWGAESLVIQRDVFLANLRSPEVQRLLSDAQLMMGSSQFPPKGLDDLGF
jgi:hypothetical protein